MFLGGFIVRLREYGVPARATGGWALQLFSAPCNLSL
jgi:hypothetical protein